MNNKDILHIEIYKEVDCSKEVALWNYWDHEHLDIVHEGYQESNVLYDKKNFLFRVDNIKVPMIPFLKFITPIFMVQDNDEDLIVYAVQMGVLSKTTISINSLSNKKCKIKMDYKFYLNGWRKMLRPLLKRLIPKWNEKVWQEDLSVKLRRQKVLEMNFRDFVGIPFERDQRLDKGADNKKLILPIPRPLESSRDLHPLSIKNKNKLK